MSNIIEFKAATQTPRNRQHVLPGAPANENEIRFYWRIMRELRAAMAVGDARLVWECLDELDVIAEYTESPALRRMCGAHRTAA